MNVCRDAGGNESPAGGFGCTLWLIAAAAGIGGGGGGGGDVAGGGGNGRSAGAFEEAAAVGIGGSDPGTARLGFGGIVLACEHLVSCRAGGIDRLSGGLLWLIAA